MINLLIANIFGWGSSCRNGFNGFLALLVLLLCLLCLEDCWNRPAYLHPGISLLSCGRGGLMDLLKRNVPQKLHHLQQMSIPCCFVCCKLCLIIVADTRFERNVSCITQ